jgi:nucleoid DNA-binding protein
VFSRSRPPILRSASTVSKKFGTENCQPAQQQFGINRNRKCESRMNSKAADAGRGKSGLIKAVMTAMAKNNTPISRRKAEKAVKAVFERMTRALWRGECVELPVGSIYVDSMPAKGTRRVQKSQNIATGAFQFKLAKVPERDLFDFRTTTQLDR